VPLVSAARTPLEAAVAATSFSKIAPLAV
jgi:hypothetical protein